MNNTYIKFLGKPFIAIDKVVLTIGSGPGYDISLTQESDELYCSLHKNQGSIKLVPANAKVRINGKPCHYPTDVSVGDRIEIEGHVGSVIDGPIGTSTQDQAFAKATIDVLKILANGLEEQIPLKTLLKEALTCIVKEVGAEEGHLISEVNPELRSEWAVLATTTNLENSNRYQKELISNTIVNDTIRQQTAICIENLIGHPLSHNASLMGARFFSIACLPLIASNRIFGVVYLSTKTPGRSIKSHLLDEMSILATQVALLLALQSELYRTRKENLELKQISPVADGFIFQSERMKELNLRLQKLAASNLNILIQGETGTGKELIAREIHLKSPRAKEPFIVVNCAAIPPSLIESILFGHTKGAYTGAQQSRTGKFLQANRGTIFLDEIGELPLEMQTRLLRVLQEKQIEAVGSDRSIDVDFRVVAATHQDLEKSVLQQKFRQDLFYRLNGAILKIPALRERGEAEILTLADHFLRRNSEFLNFSEDAKLKLLTHPWPGNVRELEQVVARSAILASGRIIYAKDVELSETKVARLPLENSPEDLRLGRQAFQKRQVQDALQLSQGNRSKAAQMLGISERTLYRILSADNSDSAC